MRIERNNILKWLGEGILIILSVLLAFFIEERRQKSNEREELITLLTDLESSFRKDSTTLRVRIFYLHKIDSSNKAALNSITKKEFPKNMDALDVYNEVKNYSLKRVLSSKDIGLLSSSYRNELYFYNSWLDYVDENYEKKYDQNCSKLVDMVYEEGEQVTFSPKFKGLLQKNIDILDELIENDSIICEDAHEMMNLTLAEIKRLKAN